MVTRLPLAALITASLFWGTAVSVTKYALRGFGPITLLAISLVAGTAVLWVIAILRGRRPPPSWRLAVLLGLFEPALAYVGDLLGLARTSAANGALLKAALAACNRTSRQGGATTSGGHEERQQLRRSRR